jgi:hypothetical protein
MFKSISAIEFNRRFIDNESCYQYLMNRKWGKEFSCCFCGCKESIKGRTYYYRRCKSCRYDESVTANTVFHGMKMPILKAFHMIFRITAKKKGMSTMELGHEVGVQQKTAWLFKRKIQVAMKPDMGSKLEGNVDVDETLLGFHTGRKDGGRSLENREAVFIAAEILDDGRTGNLGMQHIENFKADTLKCALKELTNEMASIRSDNYCSYRTIQRDLSNLKTESSQNGKSFEELHRQIMLFKNWLVGIHHKWSKQHLHAYCDEYVFRFNRRNIRKSIFNSVINKMMQQIPHPYPVIKTLCEYST